MQFGKGGTKESVESRTSDLDRPRVQFLLLATKGCRHRGFAYAHEWRRRRVGLAKRATTGLGGAPRKEGKGGDLIRKPSVHSDQPGWELTASLVRLQKRAG